MLFSRALSASSSCSPSNLPAYLLDLIENLESLLDSLLPPILNQTVFHQSLARQVILNLYPPGTGITPHVDLPKRYADGILGVSLIGGAVMSFTKTELDSGERYDVYVPARSVYVMTGVARWDWSHGIEARMEDTVEGKEGGLRTMPRETRVSVTVRWMKEGGDVLS